MRRPANGLVKGHRWAARLWTVVKKENWPELLALTSIFFVELPGIEPVSGCWSLSRAGTELRNDTYCDSPELTSVDTECAQNVPSQSLD
jgi:hypothetical protein